jgi:putative Mg2+ transporter-C (MgtC) family protein
MGAESVEASSWLSVPGSTSIHLLLRLLLAIGLGGAIGLERELSDKPAGFRTNILICLGAALFTQMSIMIATVSAVPAGSGDPTRIAAQIVSGMGFLGAGTILQARGNVRGLTTAATLWTVAAIGMTVGAGAYSLAIGATILVILVLVLLGQIERLILHRTFEHIIQVAFEPRADFLEKIGGILGEAGFRSELLAVEKRDSAYIGTFRTSGPRSRWQDALSGLLESPGVHKVTLL